jgi:transposase-like protein
MHRRPKYSPEFRERAVRLVLSSDRTIKDVAKDLGMTRGR